MLACIGVGLAAGLLSGLFGVGGGTVIVPMLVLLLHFDQRLAAGTSLAAMATGEDSYSRANEAMTRVNRLVPQIDANTDVKAAIDFNTRVQIEQMQVMNELLRVLSAQANATGAQALFMTREQMASREFMKVGAGGVTR